MCGSFCTLEAALAAAQQLTEQGWELLPIMSFAAKQDTRFGTGQFWQERLEALTSHAVLDTLQAVEPLGPKAGQCTGDRALHRGHAGKAGSGAFRYAGDAGGKEPAAGGVPGSGGRFHQRWAGSVGENIARLFQRKHYYFVPYGQDDPTHKPNSLKADFARLPAALDAALAGRQLQPVLLQNNV